MSAADFMELARRLRERADSHDGDIDLRLYYGTTDCRLDREAADALANNARMSDAYGSKVADELGALKAERDNLQTAIAVADQFMSGRIRSLEEKLGEATDALFESDKGKSREFDRACRYGVALRLCVDALNESAPVYDDYWAAAKAGEDALAANYIGSGAQ